MESIKSFQNVVSMSFSDGEKAITEKQPGEPGNGDMVELSAGDYTVPRPVKPHKQWLFLNYVAADCNLTEAQLGNIDQQELVGSDKNTHIVAYVDVGRKPNPFDSSWQNCRSYYITKDETPGLINSELVNDFGKADMSNPRTLTRYIVDAIGKFPADHVCLVLNDHGGGFTGAMADDSDGDFMTVPEIGQAIAKAEEITKKKIDIIGFDACLMAGVEVAYELKDSADILLASEELEGGPGWSYDSMLGGATMNKVMNTIQNAMDKRIDVTPEDLSRLIVEVNREHNDEIPTFSAINLNKVEEFKNLLDDLAKAIISSGDRDSIRSAITSSENFGFGAVPYRDTRDIGHIADNLIKHSKNEKLKLPAQKIKDALEELIIANETNPKYHPESRGISVYAPYKKSSPGFYYTDLRFAKDSLWDEMLCTLGIGSRPESDVTPSFWPDGSPRKSDIH